MNLDEVVDELVEERSLDALERLTGSTSDEVLEALIYAAARIVRAPDIDDTEDGIVESIRTHLVEAKPVGLLTDALQSNDAQAREFALSCLGEIGDVSAVPPMLALLDDRDPSVREAAAEHLALLTKYDFGKDAKKWREWYARLIAGREEQAQEDREDEHRRLRMQMSRKKGESADDEMYPDID